MVPLKLAARDRPYPVIDDMEVILIEEMLANAAGYHALDVKSVAFPEYLIPATASKWTMESLKKTATSLPTASIRTLVWQFRGSDDGR